ncbi:Reverse transcriptase (RNA-dependent DNA polymerase), putative [Entamoeba histolytica]
MSIITPNELNCAIKFTANWKAPGVDKIQGFWIKYLEQPMKYLLKLFNEWLNNHNEIPPHFIQGRTILVYKKGDKLDTQNYRQITCLNCLLKVYTSILLMKIENQLMQNPIEKQLSLNQIGCKKYTYASKEGLLYNTIIQQLLLKAKWKLVETYYDVSKAYDSINHQWIKQCLIYFNIQLVVINNILYILNNTYLNLYYNQESVSIINVER